MKRFISKKRIKLPRYKIIILKLLSIFLILTFLNISLNFFLTKINNTHLLNILNTNSFGSLSSFIFSKENLLYNNIYGLNLHTSKETSTKTPNKTALNLSPIVYIYNTFQTSKYKNTYYNSYNITPQITHASLIFQEYLKNNGIPSLVEKGNVAQTLKENNLAYTNSYQASRLLLEIQLSL